MFLSDSGSDYSGLDEEEEEEFDELDYREEGQFWATNDEPVQKAESPTFDLEYEDEQPSPEPVISLFAIGKLCRWFQILFYFQNLTYELNQMFWIGAFVCEYN